MPYKDLAKRNECQRNRSARIRQEWLQEHGPCVQCGSWDRLEVDHKDPPDKASHRVWFWSKERRESELAKCQVLCYGCHKAKTRSERIRPVTHGTHEGYSHHGCRCDECRLAQRDYMRLWRRGMLGVGT